MRVWGLGFGSVRCINDFAAVERSDGCRAGDSTTEVSPIADGVEAENWIALAVASHDTAALAVYHVPYSHSAILSTCDHSQVQELHAENRTETIIRHQNMTITQHLLVVPCLQSHHGWRRAVRQRLWLPWLLHARA